MIDSTYRLYDDNLILILFLRMVMREVKKKQHTKSDTAYSSAKVNLESINNGM